ncbi:MAG: hypothetical protein RLY31_1170 [Bacteroidota bacterium]|jgi:DNA polymerase-3 subunit alpha
MYLNNHTYYSLRYGTLSPAALVAAAEQLGIDTLALTDINNTSAMGEFVQRCEAAGIRPVAGIDFFRDGKRMYTGIARDSEGFSLLNRYLSHHSLTQQALPPVFDPTCLERQADDTGLPLLIIYPRLVKPLDQFRSFEFLGVRPEHVHRLFSSEVRHSPHKLLVFSPVTFLDEAGYELHRVLRAMDGNTLLSLLPPDASAPPTELLHPPAVLAGFYACYPAILRNTERILSECSIRLVRGLVVNRQTFTGSKNGDDALLCKLAEAGYARRYGPAAAGPPPSIAAVPPGHQRLRTELRVIREMDFCAYFLITWDIVRYARSAGYHHVGRGSGANSLVAYCLGITDVDPIELDLYFERFINRHRPSPPDFDIDFSWDERDDVTDYIFKRYGRDHTALLATYSTFQFHAAVRETGKVFGLPKAEIDALADAVLRTAGTPDVRYWGKEDVLERTAADPQATGHAHASLVLPLARRLQGFPHHLSIHAGGIVISEHPLYDHTALLLMPKGFPICHTDMHHAEDLGFHKFDVLSQRGLGHIKATVELVRRNKGMAVDVHDLPRIKADERVRAQLRSGRCIGCFYIESPAMRGLLRKLRCEEYVHLVAASSIIRPGVAKSGMMKEYIRRFHEPHSFDYLHPVFRQHLGETFGVMVYQEDVMKIVHHFAGMGLDESDMLRRLMSGKRREGDQFESLRQRFFDNCRTLGHPEALALEVWRQVESFAGYSFCKAHSASFAAESFQSLYLKTYFPLEFMVSVINNFGGFYRTEIYFHEARMAGATIHAPCVNHSEYLTTLHGSDLYTGFVHLSGLEQALADRIVRQRRTGGSYRSLADFVNRVETSASQLEILIRIGAFRFTGMGKCALMWEKNAVFQPRTAIGTGTGTGMLFDVEAQWGDAGRFELPPLAENELDQAFDEIELLGFPLCSPFDLLADPETASEGVTADALPSLTGRMAILVGCYVTRKDVRTVQGALMNFGTWLDRDGHFFDSVHFPDVLKRFPFRGRGVYRITGRVAMEHGFPSVEVVQMERLPWKEDARYAEQPLPASAPGR